MEFIDLPTLTVEMAKTPSNICKMASAIRLAHTIAGYPFESASLYSKALMCHKKVLEDAIRPQDEINRALEIVKTNLGQLNKYAFTKVYLHGDLNPRNIFMTSDQVLLIDWC